MNKLQKGGLDPLTKVPNFKYTINEKRKLFIGYLYPYADYFISCVTSLPFNSYSYNANCEYINVENNTQIVSRCNNSGSPLYFFTGGTVYELLNKKFNNVNMYNYCDATSDIDVALFPPKLTYNEDGDIYFLNTDGKISSFYSDFTRWTFENMVKNVISIQLLFENMEHIVNFDINDYSDIPYEHKSTDFGYNIQMIGKFYVVAFLNEDKTMFKIQVVCKVQDSSIFIIDHIIEIIIPLPESNFQFIPTGDSYSHPSINTITINRQSFNISSYNSLINDNINAYIERKKAYGKTGDNIGIKGIISLSSSRNAIHKSINHIARLFYFYELIYQNQSAIQIDKLQLLFLFGMKNLLKNQVQFLYYYKIVDGVFHTIKVDTRFFLNSYLELIIKNQYLFNIFKNTNPDYFINYTDINEMKNLHDRFNIDLFNNELFQPSGLLTFSQATGGKRRKKTRKLRSIRKFKRTKRSRMLKKQNK